MVKGVACGGKLERFAKTPWTEESEEWLALDQRLPADHLARRVRAAVALLDLQPLFDSYRGLGKRALRPDLLLKLVLYEMQNNRPSPAQWARDVRESEPVRWLLLGMEPSRGRLYDFRDRLAAFWPEWNLQVLTMAVEENRTSARRVSLDSSSVAAHASRRQVLNEERLAKRRATIDSALECLAQGKTMTEAVPEPPTWLAKTRNGLCGQKQRYAHAAQVLRQRQAANARRRSCRRQPPDKVLVSPADPEAVLARDKFNVFRPLYNVQLVRDLDSPLILAYDIFPHNHDKDVLEPLVDQVADHVGHKPEELLVDSGYVTIHHLEFCEQAGITLYGPYPENTYEEQNGKRPHTKRSRHKRSHGKRRMGKRPQGKQRIELLPKSAFHWLPDEQSYQCPEGHRLVFSRKQTQQRAESAVTLNLYTCPAAHCLACPRQQHCTRSPEKGRTVGRMENEELVDALRARMETVEGQQLYQLRSQTVELTYADLKEHRGLRRFHGRGQPRAHAEVGCLVLAHNLLFFHGRGGAGRDKPDEAATAQTLCAA
jgi:transposase